MIKIVIADDHKLIRAGLKETVFKSSKNIDVVGEAANGAELMSLLEKVTADLLVLDITMPGKNGLDIIQEVRELYPELPILVLSMHPEERFALRSLKSGASGYLCKSDSLEELVDAVNRIVLQKRKYISPGVAEQLAMKMGNTDHVLLHEKLSDREFQVFNRLVSGKRVTDIADELNLSVQTIHTYRSRIKEKMNITSNVELVRYAIQNKLID